MDSTPGSQSRWGVFAVGILLGTSVTAGAAYLGFKYGARAVQERHSGRSLSSRRKTGARCAARVAQGGLGAVGGPASRMQVKGWRCRDSPFKPPLLLPPGIPAAQAAHKPRAQPGTPAQRPSRPGHGDEQ